MKMNKWFVRFKLPAFISLVLILSLITSVVALASSVEAAVVDVTAPTNSVTLSPTQNGEIQITLTVTGKQDGTSTFEVYRDWTLSGGTFTGSNSQEFTVPPRTDNNLPATVFTTKGKVIVASGQTPGNFTLTVGVFDITNTNSTGAKLGAGKSASYQVVVVPPADTEAPTLTLPADITAEATGSSGAKVDYSASASDKVDGPVAITCSPASGSTFAIGATIVNCSAKDKANNEAKGAFNVTVQDTTAPTITLPTLSTNPATSAAGAEVTFKVTASDLVNGAVTPVCNPPSGSTFAIGATEVSCSATDAAGNTAKATFNVTVSVPGLPEIIGLPANITTEATGPSGAVVTYQQPTAIDALKDPATVGCDPASGSTFPVGPSTVKCTATDVYEQSFSATFQVNVVDTTAPALSLPSAAAAEAAGPNGAVVVFAATAADLVDGAITPTCAPASGATFPLGPTTVNCSAKDAAGNPASGSFVVTVSDTTAPVVTVPTPEPVEATGPSGAVVTFSASATDAVDGSVTVTCTPASGSTFAIGATKVNCSAADGHNNTESASFTVTVQDTTAPVVSVPADITQEATGPSGAAVTFSASATDVVDRSVPVSCTPISGSTFALGATQVTCSAADTHGNPASKSFTVTVQDTTPPALHLPDPIVAEATGPNGAAVEFAASAEDLVDGPVAVTCDTNSGATFPLGDTTVSCSAHDAANNPVSGSFTVTVHDTTPPALTVPTDQVIEATGPSGATVGFEASAVDIVDGTVAVTCTPPAGVFPIAVTTVTCSAQDVADNPASKSFTVTVQDSTPPVVNVPSIDPVEATGPSGAAVSFSASALDIVDGSVTTSCAPASGSTFAIGDTTVSCSATDAHGNTGSASFTVTVQDTTAPVVTVPADITQEATGLSGAEVTFSASALDIVDGAVDTTCTPASAATFALGTTQVTCTATDGHHNTSSASFNVKVQDTTPPGVTPPSDITVEATSAAGAIVSFTSTATDLVDGPITPTCTPASGSTFALGTTTVTCSATDKAGNTASDSSTVTVQDTTAPVISNIPANQTLEATGPNGAVVTYTLPTANDIVDGAVPVLCAPASGSTFDLGTTTVSCAASDAHHNGSLISFTVTVKDTTAPKLTMPTNRIVNASGASGAVVTFEATASDIVDGAVAPVCVPASGSLFPLGVTTVTCTAKDSHGNSASSSFTVYVRLDFKGFYQPVDNTPGGGTIIWNTVKAGSTVPLKFELFAGQNEMTSTTLVAGSAKLVACNLGAEDTVELTATGGTSLRYDTTAGQFIYNWQTPKTGAGKCYVATMTAADGSTLDAYFKLK